MAELIEQLRADYVDGQLCLFIGAGVSMDCGLPDWRGLAKQVIDSFPRKPGPPLGSFSAALRDNRPPLPDPNALRQEKAQVLARQDPLHSMRYARLDPDIDLNALVSGCLYRTPPDPSSLALAIANLVDVKRICCFNYDDILDRAFVKQKRAYRPLFEKQRIPWETPETLIFYPHGFLPDPKRPSFPATERIVLSEDDYFELYRAPYAWANLVQLTLLLNYTALFVGCSLLDPNLRRLLDVAAKARPNHSHFAIFSDGVSPENSSSYQLRYASALRGVHRQLLNGLGVQPVWVHNYAEIGLTLEQLRRDDSQNR